MNLHPSSYPGAPHEDTMKAVFKMIDANMDGELSAQEVIKAIHKNSEVRSLLLLADDSNLSATEYNKLFSRIDADSSSGVSFEEFKSFVEAIAKEEREAKMAEAKRQEEAEEERLRKEKKLGLKKARDRVLAMEAAFEETKGKFVAALGAAELSSICSIVQVSANALGSFFFHHFFCSAYSYSPHTHTRTHAQSLQD